MPHDSPATPDTDELDRAARSAFRRFCNQHPDGVEGVARLFDLNPRTAERLFARRRSVPTNIAAEVSRLLRSTKPVDPAHHAGMIAAFDAWIDYGVRRDTTHG